MRVVFSKGIEDTAWVSSAGPEQGQAEAEEKRTGNLLKDLERRNLIVKVEMARVLISMGYSHDAVRRILHLPADASGLLESGADGEEG